MAKKKRTKQSYEEYLADQYKFQETWQRYGFNETSELVTAKDQYFNKCNDAYLADLIRQGKEIGQPTRDFIADILEGKITREKGHPQCNWDRDYSIALEIYKLSKNA